MKKEFFFLVFKGWETLVIIENIDTILFDVY